MSYPPPIYHGDSGEVSAHVVRAGIEPAVVYPNSGQGWNAATRSWEGRSTFHPADVAAWVAAGARLVGGCCRVSPSDIGLLVAALAG